MNWKCSLCSEEHSESKGSCWKCGSGRDGTPPAPDFGAWRETNPDLLDLEQQLAVKFVCAKCGNRGGKVRRIATTGQGISRILDFQYNNFVTVSCKKCGFTELFDAEPLQGRGTTGKLLDVIFGH